jgi:hypothetical protein
MQSIIIRKITSLYAACSPEMGVVSFGACQDEALNNLTDELADRQNSAVNSTLKLARNE